MSLSRSESSTSITRIRPCTPRNNDESRDCKFPRSFNYRQFVQIETQFRYSQLRNVCVFKIFTKKQDRVLIFSKFLHSLQPLQNHIYETMAKGMVEEVFFKFKRAIDSYIIEGVTDESFNFFLEASQFFLIYR